MTTDLRADLLRRAHAAAAAIHAAYPEVRVTLFGSVAEGAVHAGSDIDLAVTGLPPAEHARAWIIASRAADTERLDLVRTDEVLPTVQVAIRQGLSLENPSSCNDFHPKAD